MTKNIYTPEELRGYIRASLSQGCRLLPLVIRLLQVSVARSCVIVIQGRLRWEDIFLNEDEPEIHIRPEVAKTGAERYVFIPTALASWFEFFQRQEKRHGRC